jgi:sensor histidine kinase YesM
VKITLYQAITDSVISTMLLTGFSGGLLQLYRFVHFELDGLLKFIIIHLLAGIIVSVFWVNTSKLLLFQLISDTSYQAFFKTNFVTRFFIGLLLYFTFTAFIYLIKEYFKNLERIKNEEALKTKLLESELNVLKLQVNPHFIFNTLNSISALTHIDPKLSAIMTEKLAKFIRISLEAKERVLIPLSEEIANIKRYLDIEQVRFGEKMIVQFHIAANAELIKIPSFILVPIVENAIKHGVQTSTSTATVEITAMLEPNYLSIVVSNTVEKSEVNIKPGLGVGLANVRDRLKLQYNDEASFSVRNYDNKFIVNFSFPIGNL